MGTDTKGSGATASSMVRVPTSLHVATHSQGSIRRVNLGAMGLTSGRMEVFMLGSSLRGLNTEKASGRRFKTHRPVTLMTETTFTIRNTDKVPSHGKVATCIKGDIKRTKEKGMVRCIGLMALTIKVNGREESSMVLERCHSLTVG
jgi:hypothetical protein